MDGKSVEIENQATELFSREVSPDLAILRNRLNGYLEASGAQAEQLEQARNNEFKNAELLTGFSLLLPEFDGDLNQEFLVTTDPYIVKCVQSNLIWTDSILYSSYGKETGVSPKYIIGKSMKDEALQMLLLTPRVRGRAGAFLSKVEIPHRKNAQRNGIFLRKTVTVENVVAKETMDRLWRNESSEYPTPDDARSLYSFSRHGFVIKSTSRGSVRVCVKPVRTSISQISDLELAEFDVNSHLDKLATLFGKEEELIRLREKFHTNLS